MAQNWNAHSVMNTREKILFGIVYGTMYVLSLLPFCILYLLSDFAYLIVYHIIGYRRAVIDNNIATSFPEISAEERHDLKKKFYRHLCDYFLETIKLISASRNSISKRVRYTGLELIEKAVSRGQGVTLYLAHYGNWEWFTTIGLHIPQGTFGGQVYHVLESKVMDKIMLKLRNRMGPVSIPMSEILRKMLQARQNGLCPIIGFISDQSPIIYNIPYWTEFLNHKTPFISGTERLTKKLNMTSIYMDVSSSRRGYYDVELKLMEEQTQDIPDWNLTEQYARMLETTIRRDPSLWLWSHNRWKRREEEYKKSKQ